MAKRFKLKISRVIPSLQFCRTTSAETPSPEIFRISPVNPKVFDISFPSNLPVPPPSTPECSFTKRHVASNKVVSVECGCLSGSSREDLSSDCSFPHYTLKKEGARCHVISKAYEQKPRRKINDASSDGDSSPVWVNKNEKKSQKNEENKKIVASVSSRDIGCFSREENESKETETLLSISRSFSHELSSWDELDHSVESTRNKVTTNIKKIRRTKRQTSKNYKGSNYMTVSSPEMESPAKASVLRQVIPCMADGKVRESVAVVKKSMNPYEDFKRSMLEMILEKQIFEAKDLEELLRCFLSLNSRKYHGIIVEAFSEIWEVLFCDFSVKRLVT